MLSAQTKDRVIDLHHLLADPCANRDHGPALVSSWTCTSASSKTRSNAVTRSSAITEDPPHSRNSPYSGKEMFIYWCKMAQPEANLVVLQHLEERRTWGRGGPSVCPSGSTKMEPWRFTRSTRSTRRLCACSGAAAEIAEAGSSENWWWWRLIAWTPSSWRAYWDPPSSLDETLQSRKAKSDVLHNCFDHWSHHLSLNSLIDYAPTWCFGQSEHRWRPPWDFHHCTKRENKRLRHKNAWDTNQSWSYTQPKQDCVCEVQVRQCGLKISPCDGFGLSACNALVCPPSRFPFATQAELISLGSVFWALADLMSSNWILSSLQMPWLFCFWDNGFAYASLGERSFAWHRSCLWCL